MPDIITELEPREHLELGLHSGGKEAKSLIAERIVDITDICDLETTELEQVVIKYTHSNNGLIAQLKQRNEWGKDGGVAFHFFVDEMGVAGLVTDEMFLYHAMRVGIDEMNLAETIVAYSPNS